MASIDKVIDDLEKMPEKIREYGEQAVKNSIESHGHVDTGNMLNNTRAFVHGTDVQITVWAKYASYVNDGHGGAHGKMQAFKISPKWPGYTTKKGKTYRYITYSQPGYPKGSKFFDEAYRQILAYVKTL